MYNLNCNFLYAAYPAAEKEQRIATVIIIVMSLIKMKVFANGLVLMMVISVSYLQGKNEQN